MPCTEDNCVHLFETVKLICRSASSSTFLCHSRVHVLAFAKLTIKTIEYILQ
jgi:hypothetical protein